MISSVERNNHVASDEIEGIFITDSIHCKEVTHCTSDDSE